MLFIYKDIPHMPLSELENDWNRFGQNICGDDDGQGRMEWRDQYSERPYSRNKLENCKQWR